MHVHHTVYTTRVAGGHTRPAFVQPFCRRCPVKLNATSRPDDGQQPEEQKKHDDASDIMGSLAAVAKIQGRAGRATSVILASDASEDTWRKLDKRVNKYPGTRTFTAIGTGGSEFKAAMVSAVESVVGSVHYECISEKTSSQQKYISVTVGPVWVQDCDQVLAIYAKMKADDRLKYFI